MGKTGQVNSIWLNVFKRFDVQGGCGYLKSFADRFLELSHPILSTLKTRQEDTRDMNPSHWATGLSPPYHQHHTSNSTTCQTLPHTQVPGCLFFEVQQLFFTSPFQMPHTYQHGSKAHNTTNSSFL